MAIPQLAASATSAMKELTKEARSPPGVPAGSEEVDMVARFEQWEEWDASSPLWKHAVAGSCAGVMEHIGMYPLDTIKTNMQALRPSGPQLGVTDVLRAILQERGGMGLMRGCSAVLVGCIPAHIALFTSYEYTKRRLLSNSNQHEPASAAVCGAAATLCHDVILTPMDVVKQRMQLGCYNSIGECLQKILRREGVGGLYRSMPTTLAMNLPYGSVFVASNESIKKLLDIRPSRSGEQRSVLPWYFLAAGMSGACASMATQPLDVVKTRLQTQDCLFHGATTSSRSSASGSGHPSSSLRREAARGLSTLGEGLGAALNVEKPLVSPKYSSFLPTIGTIVREEGAMALFHGTLPRMLHAVPAGAMCWGTYEVVKSFLGC